MDIEFFEFDAMDGMMRDFPVEAGYELPVGQFMVEIHLMPGRMDAPGFVQWYVKPVQLALIYLLGSDNKSSCTRWERLEARGLRPAWTEPNLLAVTVNYTGNKDPNMAEYTMINVKDRRNVIFYS
jgi:hypothetical protein